MRLIQFVMGAAAAFAAGLASAETPSDIALLFGRSEAVAGPQISPDGRYLGMRCAPKVHETVCIFDLVGGSESIVVPSYADTRLVSFYWANNDTLIFDFDIFETIRTSSGLKNYTFERAFAFNVKSQKLVALLKQYAAGYLDANDLAAILPGEPGHILIGMMKERAAGVVYDAVKVDLAKGNGRSVATGESKVYGAVHKPSGEIAASLYFDRQSNDKYTLKILAGKKVIYERRDLNFNPIEVWGLDTTQEHLIVFMEDQGAIFRLSLADGALAPVDIEALGDDTLVAPINDPRTGTVVGYQSYLEMARQHFEDPALRTQYEGLSQAFPDSQVVLLSWTDDRAESIVRVETQGLPADYYIFTMEKGELSPIGNAAPHLADRQLGGVEPILYPAADGLSIPGYLTLPPGTTRADGPFPLIVLPHGGPESRDYKSFDWWPQAYAAAGYAVLQPNFRGSSGYGSRFLEAGYGEFGGKMVTDVLDGVRWAVSQGLAEEGKVCAIGGSYGGYSALMLGAIGGKEISCVVSVNGLIDPVSILSDTTNRGFVYNYLVRYMGINEFTASDSWNRISPIQRIDEITAPVLLIAGKQDMVVPYEQSAGFAAAGRHRKDIRLVTMEGEDHFLGSGFARHRVLEESLAFLGTHLPAD